MIDRLEIVARRFERHGEPLEGSQILLAESLALIWKSTRISNSLNALRLRKRFTLL